MLLPEKRERAYRFRLALRMGLPIFALALALLSNRLITSYDSLELSFYIEVILLFTFSIYFIFYMIFNSFDERITELVSKTFTREYLYKYLKKEMQNNKNYTLILISIDNLHDINARFGISNGDKVLYRVVSWIEEYFKDKGIENFPIGHVKGGDFIIGLRGNCSEHNTTLELMLLKMSEFKVDDIEVKLSGAMSDTSFSDNLNFIIENLFELQEEKKSINLVPKQDEINPNQLEFFVINAIKKRTFIIMTQDVVEDENIVIKECFVKLKTPDGKILHPKSYVKVINRLGLMLEYDVMIFQKSIECNKTDNKLFAISVSPSSLRNQTFLTKAKEIVSNNSLAKNRVMLILAEAEYYSHIDRYNSILKSLRNMGILIAIDKLGSLNASFLYLRELDIDAVRFDQMYTKKLSNQKYRSVIEGFNLMAHSNGVKTWVRMIEDEEHKLLAKNVGADYLQGKHIAPLEKIYES